MLSHVTIKKQNKTYFNIDGFECFYIDFSVLDLFECFCTIFLNCCNNVLSQFGIIKVRPCICLSICIYILDATVYECTLRMLLRL